jgi:hypothetical protein
LPGGEKIVRRAIEEKHSDILRLIFEDVFGVYRLSQGETTCY